MSGSLFATSSAQSAGSLSMDSDITPYLEDLASRLKDQNQIEEDDSKELNWNLVDRVLAYAASAEQHIAEQQMRIRELEDLSTTDELTGLNNRRALKTHLDRTLSSARRYGDMGVLAFLDLDNFKVINDTHGHDAGDTVLKTLSKLLIDNLRETDFVARMGGDEFVFVLEKADTTYGLNRANEIRDIICNTEVKLKRTTVKLSTSMGLALYDENSSYGNILKSADNAMYEDKKFRRMTSAG